MSPFLPLFKFELFSLDFLDDWALDGSKNPHSPITDSLRGAPRKGCLLPSSERDLVIDVSRR